MSEAQSLPLEVCNVLHVLIVLRNAAPRLFMECLNDFLKSKQIPYLAKCGHF